MSASDYAPPPPRAQIDAEAARVQDEKDAEADRRAKKAGISAYVSRPTKNSRGSPCRRLSREPLLQITNTAARNIWRWWRLRLRQQNAAAAAEVAAAHQKKKKSKPGKDGGRPASVRAFEHSGLSSPLLSHFHYSSAPPLGRGSLEQVPALARAKRAAAQRDRGQAGRGQGNHQPVSFQRQAAAARRRLQRAERLVETVAATPTPRVTPQRTPVPAAVKRTRQRVGVPRLAAPQAGQPEDVASGGCRDSDSHIV